MLALLSNNHENTCCSSRLVVVIYRESVGGKVVGYASQVPLGVVQIKLLASLGIYSQISIQVLIKNVNILIAS